MKRVFLTLAITSSISIAQVSNKEIANMFIVGFYAKDNQKIKQDICNRGLGGVILFQKSPVKRGAYKNFYDASSLKQLTNFLKSCGAKPLIAVDQEGGVVQRVKVKYRYPSAAKVATLGLKRADNIYTNMAYELKSLGVNLNLAPVADLALNPKNRVIVKWGRSYGSDVKSVVNYNRVFINAMHKYNIATSLKHFPGHGSSLGDTHKGFVDVTNLWQEVELEPYKYLKNLSDTVMVAHIFNRKLDSKYPASLSKKIIKGLLRDKIGFRGVVISDDMQMGAIKKHYGLKQSINLAINAGVDILLFANQVHPNRVVTIDKLIAITKELLKEGKISESSIKDANVRINNLKNRLYR